MKIACMFCGKTAELYEPWTGVMSKDGTVELTHTICYRQWWEERNQKTGKKP